MTPDEAFEMWWTEEAPKLPELVGALQSPRQYAMITYLAAARATAQRCVEICANFEFVGEYTGPIKADGASACARLIKQEFGL